MGLHARSHAFIILCVSYNLGTRGQPQNDVALGNRSLFI